MRLFVAITLPSEVKTYLYELERKFKDTKIAKLSLTSKKNLHITLKFLGDVPEKDLEFLKEKLRLITFKKFNLCLNSLELLPDKLSPRIIFAGVIPQEPLKKLQQLIDCETLELGEVKLGGHITLGRIKQIKQLPLFLQKLKTLNIDLLNFEVTTFSLFKSELSKDGPTYTLLETYSL